MIQDTERTVWEALQQITVSDLTAFALTYLAILAGLFLCSVFAFWIWCRRDRG